MTVCPGQRRPDSIGVKTYLHILNCCQSCLISLVWCLLVHAVKPYLLPTQQFSVAKHDWRSCPEPHRGVPLSYKCVSSCVGLCGVLVTCGMVWCDVVFSGAVRMWLRLPVGSVVWVWRGVVLGGVNGVVNGMFWCMACLGCVISCGVVCVCVKLCSEELYTVTAGDTWSMDRAGANEDTYSLLVISRLITVTYRLLTSELRLFR